ncbi:sugar transferase [Agromyces lapidis]|uniref:Sugar transferase n=1 Tax=Agromyces lapidis TaxID=279574 RepID=A0ABV5SP19_9MICO|nr:sugar transferase [Agromyces lapidis]
MSTMPGSARRIGGLVRPHAERRRHPSEQTDTAELATDWHRHYRARLRITDTLIVAGATLAAASVRMAMLGDTAVATRPTPSTVVIPVLITVTWLLALANFHTRASHVIGVGASEYRRTLNATATAFALIAIALQLADARDARWYLIVAVPLGGVLLILSRWLWRKWLMAERLAGRYLSRAVVVGGPADVSWAVAQIGRSPAAGFRVVGVAVDDGAVEQPPSPTDVDRSADSPELAAIPRLANLDGVAEAVSVLRADAVIVSGRLSEDGARLRQLGWDLEGTGAELVLSSRLADVAGPRLHFRPVEGLPLLHVEIPRFDGWRHSLKRSFDVAFASVALVLLIPVYLAVALLIRLDGPGPILFRQTRCGRDGRTFRMLKFRTMVPDAEQRLAELRALDEGAGALFKIRDDPRVTRVGAFLRKYSLDELPQFWNVLVGDMSVVGPRPPLETEAAGYEGPVSRRLLIKPGLTGLWQINGRSDLCWEESVRLDLYYVENWSLMGDLVIVWRTVKVFVRPKGAY